MAPLTRSALFLAIVSSAFAGPILVNQVTTNQCASSCSTDAGKFGYEAGKTYHYTYRSEVTTHIEGAQTEKSKMNVDAVVQVQVLSSCEMLLKLTDVELTDSHPERLNTKTNVERAWEFKRSLQQHALRFAFRDGQVESVCPAAEEETWVLNVKRGILSGLQNTMHDLGTHTRNKESDVSGECYVDYSPETLWSGYKITKVKDMKSCIGRAHYDPYLQTTKFTSKARVQSLPLIRSTSSCEQTVNSYKIITATRCTEKHVFKPFSTQTSGATTEVTFSLEHTVTVSGSDTTQGKILERKSLVFDYVPKADEQTENRRGVSDVKTLLNTICTQTDTSIDPAAPATYSQLVSKMRQLTPDQLSTVYTQIKARPPCSRAESFFHDALPSLGTAGSARLMRTLLTSGKLTAAETEKWMTSLAFHTRPTRHLLADVKALLVENVSFRKATLAVSSLVNNYCHMDEKCGDHTEVRAIVDALDEALGYNCAYRTDQQYSKIMSALKGLGNAGQAERVAAKLNRCILNRDLPIELRVAATNAFRRTSCKADREELMNTFLSTQQDAELRINAYLNVMSCPTQEILSRVLRRLETEEVNQVGSFVWTHLTNLQTTASPLKQEIRKILEKQELKKAFDMDKRKFSRNIEWSTFSDAANAGVTVDSNLIWSPKSFLPRSANLNLTVDMFGESLNLIEVGGRAEGIEHLLEKMFGPSKDSENSIPNQSRARRSPIDPLHNRFDAKKDTPKGSYFIRMFGNEIDFADFQGFDTGDIFKKLDYKQLLQRLAQQHNVDETSSGTLFDASMIVPTMSGFPLRVRADGTSVLNMKASGKADLTKIFHATNPAMEIDGTVRPSAAVQVNAEMSVDANMAKSGVRMVNTLRSNTVFTGRIEARTGGIFNLDINMPDDRIELFDATSKFFIDYRDTPREQAMITANRIERNMCTGAQLTKVTGLELCSRLSAPHAYKVASAPHYPLTGPSSISLTLNKKDTYRGMHFETKFAKEQVAGVEGVKDIVKISFSTPGSRVDREFTFQYVLDRPKMEMTLSIDTPFVAAGLSGSMVNTDQRKQVTAVGTLDDKRYEMTARVDITENKFNTQFRPMLEITVPNKQPYKASGSVLYRKGKKAVIDMKMENVMQSPLELKANIDYVKRTDTYTTAVEIESPVFDAKVESTVERPSRSGAKVNVEVEYTKSGGTKQTLVHNMEYKLKSVSPKLEFELKTDLTSSQWPNYNSDIDFSVVADNNQGQANFVGGQTGTQKRVTTGVTYSKTFNDKVKKADGTFTFELPHMRWNHRSQADIELGDESIKFNFQKRCSRSVTNFKMNLARQSVQPLKTLVEVSFDSPGRHHLIKDTVIESSPGTYDHDLQLDLSDTYKIVVDSTLKKLPRPEVTAHITIPKHQPIKIEGFVNPEITDFSTSAKFELGRKVYSTGANWRFTKSGSTINSDAKFELVYPERTVVATTKMTGSKRGMLSELEVLWDAKKDQSKRFMLKTDSSSNSRAPRFNIRTEWRPAQFIDMTISAKNDKKGWYHPERDLEAKFVMQSSLESARQVSASINHATTNTRVNTQSEVSWANNKKISATMTATKRNGWQDALIVIETSTPFEALRQAKYTQDYSVRGNTYDIKNRLDWDGKFAELSTTGSGDMSSSTYEGGITLLTSYEGYDRMSMTAKHSDNGHIFNSQFQGVWRDGRTVAIASLINYERTGIDVTTSGDWSISLPLNKYKNNKLSWNHENTGFTKVKSHIDLVLDNEKTMFDVDSQLRKGSHITYELKSYLRSPYNPINNIEFDINHKHTPNSMEGFKITSSFKWAPNKAISMSYKLDERPEVFSKQKFELSTPFEFMEKMIHIREWKVIGDKLEFMDERKWGKINDLSMAKFDGFVMMTLPETQAELKFTSTYENFDNIMFNIENKKVNGVWQSRLNLDYPQSQKIELSSEIGWETPKKLKLEAKTPWPYMQMFLVDMDHEGPANNFKSKIQVAHNMMEGRIVASLDSDVSNLEDIAIQFSFTSPFEEVAYIRSGFTHRSTTQRFNTAYTFEYPRYKSSITNVLVWKGMGDIDEKLTLQYGTKKIETGMKLNLKPTVKFTTFLKTPYDGARSTVFNVEYDSRVNTLISTDFTYGDNKRYALNIDYRNNDNARSAGRFTINTPHPGYETMILSFNHQGTWNNFKNSGSLAIGSRKFEAGSEFLFRNNKVKMAGNMKTPYEGYRTIAFTFGHDGEPTEMKQDIEFIYGANEITIAHEFKFKNNRLLHRLHILTPFSDLSSLRSEIKHNGPWKNFKNQGTLEYNGRVYTGQTNFVYGKKAVRGSITVNNPDAYTVRFNHKGEMDDFTNNIQANFNGRSYSANTQFKLTARAIEVSTNVHTPHRQMRKMSASFNHRGPIRNFQNSFSLEINENAYTGAANLNVNGNVVSGSAELKLPEVYSITLRHQGPLQQFENNAVVVINTARYEAESNFAYTPERVSGRAAVKIPQEYSLTFTHTGSSMNFANDINVKFGDKVASGNSQFTYTGNDLTTKAGLVLPIRNYERFSAELKHKGVARRFETSGQLDLPFTKVKKLSFEVDHSANLPEFSTRASIGYNRRSYGFGASHKGNSNDFTTKASFKVGSKKLESELKWKQTGSYPRMTHDASIKITTPYKYLTSTETKFSHRITDTSYSGQLETLYNDEKFVDTDYSLVLENKKTFRFNIREPHSASVEANCEYDRHSVDADATVNWDKTDADSNVKLVLSAKRHPIHEFELKCIRPKYTALIRSDMELGRGNFRHGSTVQWGNGANKKVVYRATARKTANGRSTVYNGNFNLQSPVQNFEASLEHECKTLAKKTVLEMGNTEKMTIIHEFVMREPEFSNFKSDLTVKHPRLNRDVEINLSGKFKPDIRSPTYIEGRADVKFARDDITFEGKLGDASTSDEVKYIAWGKVAYPRVGIDSQAMNEFTSRGNTMKGQIKLDHMAALDGQWKTVHFVSNVNKDDKTMDLEFKSPWNQDLYARSALTGSEPGKYNVEMTGRMGTNNVKAEFALDKTAPVMDLKVDYNPDRRFHMYAKYLSSSTAQFEAYRMVSGSKILDSQLAVRLNNSRLIHGRAFFRPEIVNEIKACMGRDHGVQNFVNELSTTISTDASRHMTKVEARLAPLKSFAQDLYNHIDSRFDGLRRAYSNAYRQDKYYLRSSYQFVSRNHQAVKSYFESESNRMKQVMDTYWAQVAERWEACKAKMAEQRRITHENFVNHASNTYSTMAANFASSRENFEEMINSPWFVPLAQKMRRRKAMLENWVRETIDTVRAHPYTQRMIEWATALPEHEYFVPLRNFHNEVKAHFTRVGRSYKTAINNWYNQATSDFDTSELERLQEWFQDRLSDGKKAYQYYGLQDVHNYIKGMDAQKLDELKDRGIAALRNYIKPEKTRVTVWDPALGDFQIEVYIPMKLKNIRDFPVDDARRLVKRVQNTISRLTPDEEWIPWDTIYKYRVSQNPRDWVPPFSSHATLAGAQHYMTFDKTFYEFSGECSYVLAHDFIDKNFSVVVNYDTVDSRMTKKSITVRSDNKEIEIFPSFKVTIDNKQTEMPVEFDGTSVVRQGNRIRLDNKNGVTVSCDLAWDRCTVNVTGWYFAKTAGMLGTYNNEQFDDMLTAERRIVNRPELLADSWTVGSKCRAVNNARKVSAATESTVRPICAKFFQDQSSPFRLCFRQVDVAPFMTMCMNELSEKANQVVGEEDVCRVSAFYVEECGRRGVPLRQPRPCVSCELTDGTRYSEREDQRLTKNEVPKSADVVFVVSQRACNKAVIPKLQKLLDTIDSSFVAKGLRRNRYGVVGFGGDGTFATPHSHTIEGQLFNRNLKVGKMITDLRVSESEHAESEPAIDALDLAARYPFRAGVSKTIVLLTCETCSEHQISYPDMVELLLKRDLKLHLLTPHDFRMKSNSPKANNIWGMTRYTVYTNKHVNNLDGDVTLRRQTYMPKDLCGALAHETEGAIFNAKKFEDRKVKDFRTVVSSVVAAKAAPSECQICECIPDDTGVGQSVCRSCNQRSPFYGLLPKFDEYIEANFLDVQPPVSKPKKRKGKGGKNSRRKN